ncbi:MAG: class I mannose-6-phosphate isomerase [Planctomycetes bacterium]|nr:class I mannose-6-phosphate isomerase [Planctomycetota bacterium]
MTQAFSHEPLRLHPILVPRVWGGSRILRDLHPELADSAGGEPIGESWEVSDVGDDPALHSRVASGPAAGETLRSLLEREPSALLGTRVHRDGGPPRLPLLFKFLDAALPLSVQVHPSDALIERLGLRGHAGKTEAWVILDSADDSWIVYGLDVEYREYLERARTGRGAEGLTRVHVRRGDLVYLPSGTVHAIGPGLLLAEIQQTSDSTFRLYDWDRPGLDGKPRQLHLDEAAPIVPPPLEPCPYPAPGPAVRGWRARLNDPDSPFEIYEVRTAEPLSLAPPGWRAGERFAIFCLLAGRAEIAGSEPWGRGTVVFVPATSSPIELRPLTGDELWGLWMSPRPAAG